MYFRLSASVILKHRNCENIDKIIPIADNNINKHCFLFWCYYLVESNIRFRWPRAFGSSNLHHAIRRCGMNNDFRYEMKTWNIIADLANIAVNLIILFQSHNQSQNRTEWPFKFLWLNQHSKNDWTRLGWNEMSAICEEVFHRDF